MNKIHTVIIPSPKARNWKPVGEETVLAKKYGVQLISQKFITPDDKEEEFVFCRKAPGVTVLTITAQGLIVLVGQYKQGRKAFVFEAPAGLIWEGDNFQQKALDELAQETGYYGEKIELLCNSPSCPGPRKFDTTERLYIVTGARRVGLQKLDATEFIEVIEVSPDTFIRMCEDGEIISSGTREAFGWAVVKGYISL